MMTINSSTPEGCEAKAEAFLKKSAGVFALPMLIEAFNYVIVQGLIKTIIFGTIARIIGQQLAGRLLAFLVGSTQGSLYTS